MASTRACAAPVSPMSVCARRSPSARGAVRAHARTDGRLAASAHEVGKAEKEKEHTSARRHQNASAKKGCDKTAERRGCRQSDEGARGAVLLVWSDGQVGRGGVWAWLEWRKRHTARAGLRRGAGEGGGGRACGGGLRAGAQGGGVGTVGWRGWVGGYARARIQGTGRACCAEPRALVAGNAWGKICTCLRRGIALPSMRI